MSMSNSTRLPCPFCGCLETSFSSPFFGAFSGPPAHAKQLHSAHLYCLECGASGPVQDGEDEASAREAAVVAWNERVPSDTR
jgi:Lar family restriction alleviation protein